MSLFEVAYILNLLGEIKGRTRIQKIVYILKYLGYPFSEDFSYNYFGPYSDDLRKEIDFLTSLGILDETVQGSTYVYRKTNKMGNFLKTVNKFITLKGNKKLSSLIKELNKSPLPVLEVSSTILFLKKEGLQNNYITSALNELKPDRKSYFKEAFKLADSFKTRSIHG